MTIRNKAASLAVAALVAAPLGATPAAAAESMACEAFPYPYSQICGIPIEVVCTVFPTLAICPP